VTVVTGSAGECTGAARTPQDRSPGPPAARCNGFDGPDIQEAEGMGSLVNQDFCG